MIHGCVGHSRKKNHTGARLRVQAKRDGQIPESGICRGSHEHASHKILFSVVGDKMEFHSGSHCNAEALLIKSIGFVSVPLLVLVHQRG